MNKTIKLLRELLRFFSPLLFAGLIIYGLMMGIIDHVYLLYLIPIGFLFFGYLALRAGLIDLKMSQEAQRWPHAKGTFLTVEIEKERNKDSKSRHLYVYGINVEYRYEVKGKEFISNRLTFADVMSSDLKKVNKKAESLVDMDDVNVFYNPNNPEESVINPGLAPGIIISLSIGSIFTLFGLGCASVLAWTLFFRKG